METRKRSLLKALTWRFVGVLFTVMAAWGVTGSARTGMIVGVVDLFVKTGMFYLHERLWHRIQWGLVSSEQVSNGGGI